MSSTAALRLKQSEFYLDESIYSHSLSDRIRQAGAVVHVPGHQQVITFGTFDDVWLTECGNRGWIVLMRDKHIRRRPLELAALKASRVPAFVCTAGEATADEVAMAVERHLRKFANMAVSEPKPFLYAFALKGSLSRVKLTPG